MECYPKHEKPLITSTNLKLIMTICNGLEDTAETRPLRVCQLVSMNVSSLQKLTRKMFVCTAPCSQLSKQIKLTEQSYLEACPQVYKLARTARNFIMQENWQQVPTQIRAECTLVSSTPHPLLLPIWRQQSLVHHVVVLSPSTFSVHHLPAAAKTQQHKNPLVPAPLESLT